MKSKNLFFLIFLITSVQVFSQSWTFNSTNGLQGWAPFRLTSVLTANSVILTTNGQNNPRIDHAAAGINATNLKFAVIKIKNASGGPTMLRINNGANFKSRIISTNDAVFKTYFIDMTDVTWTGTINNLQLAFKTDDGTAGGGNYTSSNVNIEIQEISFITNPYAGLSALYVDPINGNDSNSGAITSPLQTIPNALNIAANNSISSVYLKTGSYTYTSSIDVITNSNHLITVSPEPSGTVKLNLKGFRNFRFFSNARNIEIKGFEINGQSNALDHYTIISQYLWQPATLTSNPNLSGGGIAFNIEQAQDIKITDNYIHDFYQKAVNIEDGRYVTIKGNIITNIALTSLSGGHGIMRQQGSGSFADADDVAKYRWDIDANLIFNVHQRIYSWVPWKGYLNMTLDEGKPILIDETPSHDQNMKARIKDNVVAYFKIDGIRLKPTNNLEVRNNSLFASDVHADGITDTTAGYNLGTYGSPFVNFMCYNNAVQVNPIRLSYELGESIASTNATFGNNYSAFGTINPVTVSTITNTNLFTNPENGNFTLNSGIPSTVGVSSAVLSDLNAKIVLFNVTLADSNWHHNHLKNTQTMLDNIPGLEDGVAGNETVFTDAGMYDISDLEFNLGRKAYYFSVDPTWKTNNGVTNAVLNQGNGLDIYDGKYEIITPEEYSTWYDNIKVTYLRDSDNNGSDDAPYDRIRYGESVIAQNKIFQNNSLHVVEINASNDYTKTTALTNTVTLDGDILIDFKYTPAGNEVYDLITANSLNTANATTIFDRVRIVGYTGPYTLQIVPGTPAILRLTLTSITLGNAETSKNTISLFPNPSKSTDGFYINTTVPSNRINVKMYNAIGQKINLNSTQITNKSIHFIPKNKIEKGVYFVSVVIDGKEKTLKLLIQ